MIKGWRKAYHEIGQFMASNGAKNELFSDFESIASEINRLETRIKDAEQLITWAISEDEGICDLGLLSKMEAWLEKAISEVQNE